MSMSEELGVGAVFSNVEGTLLLCAPFTFYQILNKAKHPFSPLAIGIIFIHEANSASTQLSASECKGFRVLWS